jgi:hypothetical protein
MPQVVQVRCRARRNPRETIRRAQPGDGAPDANARARIAMATPAAGRPRRR